LNALPRRKQADGWQSASLCELLHPALFSQEIRFSCVKLPHSAALSLQKFNVAASAP
jgi:hypothetical protein